jgi:hypothetical protein
MASATVEARCPSCGQDLRATIGPVPATQWFPCPRCGAAVPVVAPRDLPPLYSWEIVPALYPLQSVARRPRWKASVVASLALVAATLLSAACAGLLGYDGYVASEPATFVVSGEVGQQLPDGSVAPLSGAQVVLYENDNQTVLTRVTGLNGSFQFSDVPAGGIELNVTGPPSSGDAPLDVYTFASRSYSTQTQGLLLTLQPGTPSNTTVDALTPFPDLATLLSYAGGGAVLCGGAALAAGFGAFALRRPRGTVLGVIGSGAAVSVPAVVLILSLSSAFPVVTAAAAVAGGLGAFALVLAVAQLATQGEGSGPARSGPA